jgi:hypothetical protein
MLAAQLKARIIPYQQADYEWGKGTPKVVWSSSDEGQAPQTVG